MSCVHRVRGRGRAHVDLLHVVQYGPGNRGNDRVRGLCGAAHTHQAEPKPGDSGQELLHLGPGVHLHLAENGPDFLVWVRGSFRAPLRCVRCRLRLRRVRVESLAEAAVAAGRPGLAPAPGGRPAGPPPGYGVPRSPPSASPCGSWGGGPLGPLPSGGVEWRGRWWRPGRWAVRSGRRGRWRRAAVPPRPGVWSGGWRRSPSRRPTPRGLLTLTLTTDPLGVPDHLLHVPEGSNGHPGNPGHLGVGPGGPGNLLVASMFSRPSGLRPTGGGQHCGRLGGGGEVAAQGVGPDHKLHRVRDDHSVRGVLRQLPEQLRGRSPHTRLNGWRGSR